MFLEGSTTSKEADDQTNHSNDNDEQSCAVEIVTEERKVVTKRSLQYRSSDYQHQADYLRISTSTIYTHITKHTLTPAHCEFLHIHTDKILLVR